MSKESEELLPCPFCGGEGSLQPIGGSVLCDGCHLKMYGPRQVSRTEGRNKKAVSEELLPCPFCSSAPLWLPGERHVICEKCHASAPPTWWNRRPDSPEVAQLRADWRFYRKGFIELADALGGVSWDDTGRIGDVMSAEELLAVIKQLQKNQTLTLERQRLQRENEKYRRKLAKRRATVMRKQWDPEFGFGEFSSWYSMWRRLSLRARVPQMRLQMRMDFKKDRNRNPELLRFLKWQDEFAVKGKP